MYDMYIIFISFMYLKSNLFILFKVCTRLNDVRSLIDDVMNVIEGRAKRACGIAQQNANESEAISENLRKSKLD